jgi:hypothetical protein
MLSRRVFLAIRCQAATKRVLQPDASQTVECVVPTKRTGHFYLTQNYNHDS